jgi:hypothetical protein
MIVEAGIIGIPQLFRESSRLMKVMFWSETWNSGQCPVIWSRFSSEWLGDEGIAKLRRLDANDFSMILQSMPVSLNPLCPMMKDEFKFRPLNFTQKFLNANEKILWHGNCCPANATFMCPKSQKVPGQDYKTDGVLE